MSDDCPQCDGNRYVCEDHPNAPWPHPKCAGAGQPCPVCNDDEDMPRLPPDFRSDINTEEH